MFAARLLAELEAAGFPYAPRHRGVDPEGCDILTFIPDETTTHPFALADRLLLASCRARKRCSRIYPEHSHARTAATCSTAGVRMEAVSTLLPHADVRVTAVC